MAAEKVSRRSFLRAMAAAAAGTAGGSLLVSCGGTPPRRRRPPPRGRSGSAGSGRGQRD